jgi:UDP-N-acetylenolpyruvoylglucosamine reductase
MRLGTAFQAVSPALDEVGAGFPVAALAPLAAGKGLAGVERQACVAGSVGAALLHDDGWDEVVEAVRVLRRGSAVEVGLDEARRKKPVVLSARLRLAPDLPADVAKRTAEAWAKQRPPSGSWYEPLRRGGIRDVLSTARLPLVRLRQVAIPELAPELLVNLGEGTAADLLLLHRSAIERVSRVHGIDLRTRIKWAGTEEEEPWSSGASASGS